MSRVLFTSVGAALLAAALGMPAQAQQAQRPPIETTKVDGTDNVYSSATATIRRSSSSPRTA